MPEELPVSPVLILVAGDFGGLELGIPAADLAAGELAREQSHERHVADEHRARRRGDVDVPSTDIVVRPKSLLLPHSSGRIEPGGEDFGGLPGPGPAAVDYDLGGDVPQLCEMVSDFFYLPHPLFGQGPGRIYRRIDGLRVPDKVCPQIIPRADVTISGT